MSTKINEIKRMAYPVNGKLLNFNKPQVMAIVNLTPDSFYDGGKFGGVSEILNDVAEKLKHGATIIDIGAASSRPGSEPVTETEEWQRLEAPLRAIRRQFPDVFISVDTYRSGIAEKCLGLGADIINDISGGDLDTDMFNVIASAGVPYVLMHMQGTPKDMQVNPVYEDVVLSVKSALAKKIARLSDLGHSAIIVDPGYGFGKTLEQNYLLLKHQQELTELGFPILAGVSRKSMINKVAGTNPVTALNGTTVLNTIALLNAANILRVHDVLEAKQVIDLISFYNLAEG
ncbi:MAG: dihydropteroate synthase [Sediminibacterium sp.]|nr:dihydropteroate synthase [Sediminibacterium sp.]